MKGLSELREDLPYWPSEALGGACARLSRRKHFYGPERDDALFAGFRSRTCRVCGSTLLALKEREGP